MDMFNRTVNDRMLMGKYSVSDRELIQLHERSSLEGISKQAEGVRYRLQGGLLDSFLERNKNLIQLMTRKKSLYTNSFHFPYLIMLADHNGVVQYIDGDEESVNEADSRFNIGVGSSMGISSAGTNAISASICLKRPTCLMGMHHYLKIFSSWVSICIPIYSSKDEPLTYLMFASGHKIPYLFLIPFLETLASYIQTEVRKYDLKEIEWLMEESIERSLGHYNLSNREKEVAKYWLMDLDYRQIADIVGISEHTVRVYVGKINSKLGVKSKASFILKVLIGI